MKKQALFMKTILIFLFTFSLLNLAKSQVTVRIIPDKDNTISSTSSDANNGSSVALRTGTTGADGGYTIHRTLLHFDLSSIPAGSKIDSATLTLYVFRVGNEATGVALHKLTENWGEGDATWSHAFFPDFTWTTEGGNFEPIAAVNTGNVSIGSLVIPNLTTDVQSWVNDSAGNYGWILKGADEDKTYSAKLIASREQQEIYRPVLSVTYTSASVKVPTVSLAIENNILKYATPARIKLNATASDEDGTITKVEFYKGSALLHTDTEVPYDFEWKDVPAGNYRLTAKAFDNSGYVTTSNTIPVFVVDENISGELDSSFGVNGIVKANFRGQPGTYTKSAIQSDGKIVVARSISSGDTKALIIARYNTDGSIDSSFSKDGYLIDSVIPFNSIAIQPDGKIVVGGRITDVFPYSSVLARYNIDGSVDNSFSEMGRKTISELILYSLAISKDGRLVVAGEEAEAREGKDFLIIAFNPDGSLDKSFSGDGKQYIDFGDFDYAASVAIQKDGKIVVAGGLSDEGSVGLARLNIDGSLDKSFSDDGRQTTIFSGNDEVRSLAIANDGKIVVSGSFYSINNVASFIGRFNPDGSVDSSFSADGMVLTRPGNSDPGLAVQGDGKIILSASAAIIRYNINGSLDSSFSYDGKIRITDFSVRDIVIDSNKLYATGFEYTAPNVDSTFGVVARYLLTGKQSKPPTVSITTPTDNATFGAGAYIKINATASDADGTISKVEFYNGNTLLHTETVVPYGYQWKHVPAGNYTLTVKATDNSGLVTTSAPVNITVVPNVAPTVNITNPANNQTIAGPATIRLQADAKDADGKITSVEFYNGTTLLRIEYKFPYTFVWRNVPVGNYSITAKATDNLGAVTTSAVVNISVVPNKAPTVSIINPANEESFTASANISLIAAAQDPDGTISRVEFYNGSTLLNIQYTSPYTHTMRDVPAGTYTITAKAIDNLGLSATSASITVTVAAPNTIVSSKPSYADNITGVKDAISLKVYPNPVRNIVNIYTKGLKQNKQATISIISASGAVMKMIQSNSSTQTTQLDVSSLVSGVYTIRVISGDRMVYKKFVKL